MQRVFSIRDLVLAIAFLSIGVFGIVGAASAKVVAVYGTLSPGDEANYNCNINTCDTNLGDIGPTSISNTGTSPDGSGVFTNELVFTSSGAVSIGVAGNQAVGSDVALLSLEIYSLDTGGALDGAVTGTLVPGASAGDGTTEVAQLLTSAVLAANTTYFVRIVGVIDPVNSTDAYNQQLTISAVPLPPALFLLATALFGLIGVARIRRSRSDDV